MTVLASNESGLDFPLDYEAIAARLLEGVLEHERCPYEAEVSLALMAEEEIRELNRKYRGIDAPTDVLSFPMAEFAEPADFSRLEAEGQCCFHPESGELLLGDIFISIPHVLAQAEAYGHTALREFSFLVVHSLLHLLGYDHMEEGEAAAMEQRQREILDSLEIHR